MSLEERKRFPCTFESCDYRASKRYYLHSHTMSKHTPGRTRNFPCSLCPLRFYTDCDRRRHIATHVRERVFGCDKCTFSSHDRTCLTGHVRTQHERSIKFECTFPSCNYSTFDQSNLKCHRKRHDPDPSVRCPFSCDFPKCDYRTRWKRNLRRHINARHSRNRSTQFPCPLCPKLFLTPNGARNHVKLVHTKEETFRCGEQQCKFKNHSPGSLHVHHRVKHGKPLKKKIKCDSCDYRTYDKCHFDLHTRRKHGVEKRFKCDFQGCDFETNYPASLKNHQLIHEINPHKQYPFACKFFPICDFRRRYKYRIKVHERRHQASKGTFECQVCMKTYPDVISLKFHHELVHGNKCFNCSQCEFVTYVQSDLSQHVKINHRNEQLIGIEPNRVVGAGRVFCSVGHKVPIVILRKIHLDIL